MENVVSLDLRAVYESHLDAVVSFVGKLGLTGADREDVVHDTFVVAMSRASSFDASRPVQPWLAGIAFRVIVARTRRSAATHEVLETAPDAEDLVSNPEQSLVEKRRLELLRRALSELSDEQGTVLVMHDLHGLGAPEIAASMGAPLATTYSRLRLARQNFATIVRRLQPEAA